VLTTLIQLWYLLRMKLAVIGAGSFRTPAIYRALADGRHATRFDEVIFHDVDEARLERIRAVFDGIDAETQAALPYRMTSVLDDGLEGADVVYCAIRVGGLAGRVVDETVAVEEGVIGQETVGAGGLAFAMRTVPRVVEIAERVLARAPGALFINFTNPAGLVTEALQRVLGDDVVGICDAPPDLFARVATALELPAEQLWFDYFGINHLGWIRRVEHRGRDLLPELLGDAERLERIEEGRLFGSQWLQSVGMLPNEYLYYYYYEREVLASMQRGNLRAPSLVPPQTAFYEGTDTGADALATWRAAIADREATYMAEAWQERDRGAPPSQADLKPGGYGQVALEIVDAVFQNRPRVMVLNARNRSSLPFLDERAVVEVPCVVGPTGVRPLAVGGEFPAEARSLIEQVRAAERTAIDAALNGSRALAVRALALHPLVHSVETARRIVDRYLERQPDLAGVLH
jgi:6-phospho-beta-glucosidase